MSNTDPETASEDWTEMIEDLNDAMSKSIEQNMQAQAAFIESWSNALDGAATSAEQTDENKIEAMLTEGMEGYGRAHEVWMDAAERMAERVTDAAEGEDVSITEFRDIWLRSANEAFSEVMSTTAFAAGTGQTVSRMMDLQRQADNLTQDALEQLGFATREDVAEVGARLVELERRQQEVSSNQRDAATITDVAELSATVSDVSSDVAGLDERFDSFADVSDDIGTLEENVESVSERLDKLEERQGDISAKLDQLLAQVGGTETEDASNGENQ